jgi:hypothetical protein
MTTTVTRENFTAAMEQAVKDRGEDFVYPDEWNGAGGTCRYQLEDGTPACIVGYALHLIDPALVPGPENYSSADALLVNLGAPVDVANAARTAQFAQDFNQTWGEALQDYRDGLD